MRAAWPFLLALLLPIPASAAPADGDLEVAKKLFEQVRVHETEGRWAEALDLLQRILLVKETAGIRFHIALCRENIGQLVAAEVDYQRASELATQMKTHEGASIIKQAATALAALHPRIPQLTIQLSLDLETVDVELDGRRFLKEQFNQKIQHDPGILTLRATAPGYKPFEHTFHLRERSEQTIVVTLVPEPKVETPLPPSTFKTPPPPPSPPLSTPRWPIYVSSGVGVAAASSSLYFYLQYRRLYSETGDICRNSHYICDLSTRRAKLRDYRNYGLATGGIALLSFGVATYFAVSSPKKNPVGSQTTLFFSPTSVHFTHTW